MRKLRTNEKVVSAVSQRLKELRKERGISQDSMFIDTDYNIGRIESGKANITVSTLANLCDYLGITVKEFFSGIED